MLHCFNSAYPCLPMVKKKIHFPWHVLLFLWEEMYNSISKQKRMPCVLHSESKAYGIKYFVR